MLVSNEISKNQYVGDGSATEFAYTFPILDATHIEVYRQLPTETALEAKLVPAEEYTVEGAGVESGGKVVFKVAPSSGTKLSILRNVPITQLYQYQELDSFPAESHENALAKLTMICQGMDERLDRAIVVSPTDTVTPDELRNNIFDASQKAQDSASAAKDSETAAAASESSAASSAEAAASSESNASSSATAAAASEAAAAGSASAAASSAQNAAASESSAAGSAAAAADSKTAAATSESNAAGSASAAASSEAAATNSAAAAASSASSAAASASSAAASESSATTSKNNAAASAAAAASSESNAAGSASAAANSAQNAAESENNAANSAAAILELKIEVNTLNPGEQATASYDPVTGILTLGVPKGDSGDAAIATPTSLGSVMPQTGEADGLTLGANGSLRVRQATATQRGSVLASTTAVANTVPQAKEDGTLDASWVPRPDYWDMFPPFVPIPIWGATLGGSDGRRAIIPGETAARENWILCDGGSDGKGGTVPDIRGRYIRGVSEAEPEGTTGGSEDIAVALSGSTGATTLTIAQMPSHSHSFTAVRSAKGRYMESGNLYENGSANTSATGGNGSHTHPLSGSVSGTHTDPHLAMNFFIKVV